LRSYKLISPFGRGFKVKRLVGLITQNLPDFQDVLLDDFRIHKSLRPQGLKNFGLGSSVRPPAAACRQYHVTKMGRKRDREVTPWFLPSATLVPVRRSGQLTGTEISNRAGCKDRLGDRGRNPKTDPVLEVATGKPRG
jgi:hypothetical protein